MHVDVLADWMMTLIPLADAAQPRGLFDLPMVIMLVASIFIFYFFLIRPQKKRDEEVKSMLANVKKNDEVMTNGGIVGHVVQVKEKRITIRTGDGDTKLTLVRHAIIQILKPSGGKAEKSDDADSDDDDETKSESPSHESNGSTAGDTSSESANDNDSDSDEAEKVGVPGAGGGKNKKGKGKGKNKGKKGKG